MLLIGMICPTLKAQEQEKEKEKAPLLSGIAVSADVVVSL